MSTDLALHSHGKSRVRLGRTWREGATHHFVEWTVNCMVDSPMEKAFIVGDNTGMTSTDTQRGAVYYVAKKLSERATIEEFAVALGKHFVQTYPLISKAKIYVEQKPWTRVQINGQAHDHGFTMSGTETRTVRVTYEKDGHLEMIAGLRDLQVLKTTQSGYEGYLKDKLTTLPETKDRILATAVTSTWKYTNPETVPYDVAFDTAKQAMIDLFFGPPKGGVYSPAVQYTMHEMGVAVLARVPQIESIFFNCPNLHFIPSNPVTSFFANDVYLATSEPHGNIECVVSRKGAQPQALSKL